MRTGHGLSEREQAVMDLADAGVPHAAIAAELGLKRNYVRQVTTMYGGCGDLTERKIDARQGCAAMAAAIAATGRSYA